MKGRLRWFRKTESDSGKGNERRRKRCSGRQEDVPFERRPCGEGADAEEPYDPEEGTSRYKERGVAVLVFLLLAFQIITFIWHKWESYRFRQEPERIPYSGGFSAGSAFPALPDSLRPAPSFRRSPASGNGNPDPAGGAAGGSGNRIASGRYSEALRRKTVPSRRGELFRFDPNTVSEEELCRLGFTPRQARTVINYRRKGGVFRKREDFSRLYVVDRECYLRLEPWIEIRQRDSGSVRRSYSGRLSGKKHLKIDLNRADSSALDSLRGIGGYYAVKILRYRERLGGFFCCPEQLAEIPGIDSARFSLFREQVYVVPEEIRRFSMDTAGYVFMSRHPYIGSYRARGILQMRRLMGPEACTPERLVRENILTEQAVEKLRPLVNGW